MWISKPAGELSGTVMSAVAARVAVCVPGARIVVSAKIGPSGVWAPIIAPPLVRSFVALAETCVVFWAAFAKTRAAASGRTCASIPQKSARSGISFRFG